MNTKEVLKKLELYVPIVDRVHGAAHPEFHDVHRLFKDLKNELHHEEPNRNNFLALFEELRQVTDRYRVPTDVCESYEAVYDMLSKLDDFYTAS